MEPVYVDLDKIEHGSEPTLITASGQSDVRDLPAARTPDGSVVSCWRFSDEDRANVARGGDLYVFLRANDHPIHPMSLVVEERPAPDPTLAARMGVDRIGGHHQR